MGGANAKPLCKRQNGGAALFAAIGKTRSVGTGKNLLRTHAAHVVQVFSTKEEVDFIKMGKIRMGITLNKG